MTDVFKKLAIHLDKTPSGFPETESGVELRILKQLFTEPEAELALCLMQMPEPAEAIAERAGKDPETVKSMLIEMGVKGLVIHVNKDNKDTFMLLHFVVGIWEYQVNRLTEQLIKDFNEYVPYLIKSQYRQKTQQLRVVPVNQAVNVDLNVMDYDRVEHIIRSQSKILVAPCICRKEHTMMDKGCDKPLETCLIFGGGAYIYEKRGVGRTITQEEALEIVEKGIQSGLVPQPSNSQKPINICLCCSCCCQVLKNIKDLEEPSKVVSSNFHAKVDADACTGCQACEEICPMEAVSMTDEAIARVEKNRCIGCGLCVNACEFDAMSLRDKDQSEQMVPPANLIETYMAIAKEKGFL